jgi:DNA topoisomerase VI subunit A
MKQQYRTFNFHDKTLRLIFLIDKLVNDYVAQGYMLSVRQIYYQLVSRDIVPNTERSYKNVASVINDGRLAGYIDWDAIEDRGRDIEKRPNWENGASIVQSAANSFHMDYWDTQNQRVFIIVEKAALQGVLGGVCRRYDVPLLAARGYPSVSVVRELVREYLQPAIDAGQRVTIYHMGDHDPSGIDMTRDLQERCELFIERGSFNLQRIALTMSQVEEYEPPPNPAKVTDSRFEDYAAKYGDESWELDALEPSVLEQLAVDHIEQHIDEDKLNERKAEIEVIRVKLQETATKFKRDNL